MSPSGVLFCVGGRGGSGDPFRSIECYSINKNNWFFGPEMNSRRRHVGVISVGGKVYAVGGHDGNEHLGSMEVFDPLTNKWMMKASMNTKRYVSQDPHGTKFKSYSTIHHFLLMLKNCVSVLPLFGFPNFCFVLFFSYFVA